MSIFYYALNYGQTSIKCWHRWAKSHRSIALVLILSESNPNLDDQRSRKKKSPEQISLKRSTTFDAHVFDLRGSSNDIFIQFYNFTWHHVFIDKVIKYMPFYYRTFEFTASKAIADKSRLHSNISPANDGHVWNVRENRWNHIKISTLR